MQARQALSLLFSWPHGRIPIKGIEETTTFKGIDVDAEIGWVCNNLMSLVRASSVVF